MPPSTTTATKRTSHSDKQKQSQTKQKSQKTHSSPVKPHAHDDHNYVSKCSHGNDVNHAECCNDYPLLNFSHLPEWLRDNPSIQSGYRVNIGWRRSCHSACHLHNETVNVWTHLLGCIVMGIILILTMYTMSPHGVDRINLHVTNNTINSTATIPQLMPNSEIPLLYQFDTSDVNDVIHRLKSHIPDIEHLTTTLRTKADNLQTYIANGVDEMTHGPAGSWKEEMRHAFVNYVENIEQHLSEIKNVVTTLCVDCTSNLEQVRALLMSNVGGIATHLHVPHLDIGNLANSILHHFHRDTNTSMEIRIAPHFTSPFSMFRGDLDDIHEIESVQSSSLNIYLNRYPVALFIISAMCCMFFSAVFHLFQAVSARMAATTQALDYSGICMLIVGSTIPIVYYGFYCNPIWKWGYILATTLAGASTFYVVMSPTYRSLKFRTLKTCLFMSLGFFGGIPLTHLMFHFGEIHFIMYYLIGMGACYLIGAAIYLAQIPERWWPGRFDIFLSSHQLWHMFIFVAVLVHYIGLMQFYEWRMTRVCKA